MGLVTLEVLKASEAGLQGVKFFGVCTITWRVMGT